MASQDQPRWLRRVGRLLPFVMVAALALGLRAWQLDYGLPQVTHPDEMSIVGPALRIADTSEGIDLDPGFYLYPGLQMHLVAAVLWTEGLLSSGGTMHAPAVPGPITAVLVARWTTVVFGVATVVMVSLAGAILGGRRAGLAAGLLFAVAPLPVLDCHYANVDVPMTFWCVVAVVASACFVRRGHAGWLAAAAAAVGFAAASKYTGLLLAPLLPAVGVLAHLPDSPGTKRSRRRSVILVVAACGVAALAFVAAAPFAVIQLTRTTEAIAYEARHMSGGHFGFDVNPGGWPFYPLVYQLAAGLPFALGLGLYLVVVAGVVQALRRPRWTTILPLIAALPLFISICWSRVVFLRYLMPVLPLLVLVGALWLADLLGSASGRVRVSGGVLLVVAACSSAALTISQLRNLEPQTATQVSRWIVENVPPGSEIAVDFAILNLNRPPDLTVPWERYRFRRFRVLQALGSGERPDWLVVSGWSSKAWMRGRLGRGPVAGFYRRLGSEGSSYREMVAFRPRFLNEDLYGRLDPMFENFFENGDYVVYRRRGGSDHVSR